MAVRHGDDQIASVLNRLGHSTGKGKRWNQERVATARRNHSIPGQKRALPDPDRVSLSEAARICGVSHRTIERLVEAGLLHCEQATPRAPWEIGVGVTVTAASGDDGATDGVADKKLHVDLPACLPPVLACGGTRLDTSKGTITSETVWNELAKNEGATGGGGSRIFALPSYQSKAGVPTHPETKFAGRGVPDVAGDADP